MSPGDRVQIVKWWNTRQGFQVAGELGTLVRVLGVGVGSEIHLWDVEWDNPEKFYVVGSTGWHTYWLQPLPKQLRIFA